VLLVEDNVWLKKTAVKALALTFIFPVISIAIRVIPDAIELINRFMHLFDETFEVEIIDKIVYFLEKAVEITKYVIFILLGIRAFSQGTIKLPLVDSTINKHMN